MKLLIIGSPDTLVKRLTVTARKADWEIYLLLDRPDSSIKPARVFEQYIFPYDSDAIMTVIDSVAPDIVLFMGVYDACFPWRDPPRASARFYAGLSNVMFACQNRPALSFFYLSTQEVFSAAMGDVGEDAATRPESGLGLLSSQGEELCLQMRRLGRLDATVIRLDRPYGPIESKTEFHSPIENMVIDACLNKRLTVPENSDKLTGLYVSDAAEGIYRILNARKRAHAVYQLSGGEGATPLEIAQLIQNAALENIQIDIAGEPSPACRLTFDRAREEFGFVPRYAFERAVPELTRHIQGRAERFKPDAPPDASGVKRAGRTAREWGKDLFPFLVNCLFLCAAVFARGWLARHGYGTTIDPLLLYPLLLGCMYGKRHAVFASAFSVLHAFVTSGHPFAMLIDSGTYLWVAEVFIFSMVTGHLRDSLETVRAEAKEDIGEITQRRDELRLINESNKRIKRAYEKRLIDYSGSLGKIYQVTRALNALQPGEVMFAALRAITDIMQCRDAALYIVDNQTYCRLFAATSERARALGKSLRYGELKGLYQAITEKRVFINKEIDVSLPMMANGVFEGDRLSLIVMLWGMELENMTLHQANQFSVVCSLVQLSLGRAQTYLKALENERFLPGTRVMDSAAFRELLNLFDRARREGLMQYALLRVSHPKCDIAQCDVLLRPCVRGTDYIGQSESGALYVLLPNTSAEETPYVTRRIEAAGLSCAPCGEAE